MKPRITRSIVPNLLTLANLFSGFVAIIKISEGDFKFAALFILLGAIFDMLDGLTARLIKASSEFGVELDSLCDAITFGVAPSFMLYKMHFYNFGELGLLISALPALAGVSRLARFNVQLSSFEDKKYFTGLPIPAGALTVVSYCIFYYNSNPLIQYLDNNQLTSIVSIVTALAMVSTIKYENLPKPTKSTIKEQPIVIGVFVIALIVIIYTKGLGIFPFMFFYIFAGAIRYIYYWFKIQTTPEDDIDEDAQ